MDNAINGGAAGTLEPDFKYEVSRLPGGENILRCFACGTCVLSCPVSEVKFDYSPRRIIHMVLLGLKEEVLRSSAIWYCMTCYRCHVRCPQDVKYPEIMRVLRYMALEQGYVGPEFVSTLREAERACQEVRKEMLERVIEKRESRD